MQALIDLDIPVFTECASAANRGNPFGGDDYQADIPEIVGTVMAVIDDWTEAAEADNAVLVYSHPSRRNFRKYLMPGQYKAGRAVEKPGGYYEVLDEVLKRYQSFAIDGVEGDDAIGILHTSGEFGETVTVSTDKDMRTLPGWIFNPMKQMHREVLTANEATKFWMWQVLVGDTADGYKGCPGVGPVKAGKVLEDIDMDAVPELYLKMCWDVVFSTYRERYAALDAKAETNTSIDQVHSAAVAQARMARILHREDYARESDEIRLWHPDSPEWLTLEGF
jgi:DNA polymerase-1